MAKFVLDKIDLENIVGKEENAGYQHFLLFLQCFQEALSFFRVVKSQDCVVKWLRDFGLYISHSPVKGFYVSL